jgi:NADH-quinone oxidoreductase subunit J
MIATIGFGVVAACLLLSALFVIRATNLVHAVLWLGVTLGATAVLYAMMGASFLAGVQVLLYVGGVVTLMIFGVMLTRRHDGLAVPAERTSRARGALVAAALFGVLAAAVSKSELPAAAAAEVTTGAIGVSMLTTHILAFEVLSLLLLAAIIGAIVIARKRDPGAAPPPAPRPTGLLRPEVTTTPEDSGTP